MECKNFRHYHNNLKLGFRFSLTSLKNSDFGMKLYQLDPAHWYRAPILSWNQKCSLQKVEIELLDDRLTFVLAESLRDLNGVGSLLFLIANNKCLEVFSERTSVFGIFLDVASLNSLGTSLHRKWLHEQLCV